MNEPGAENRKSTEHYRAASHWLAPVGGGNYLLSLLDRQEAEIVPDFIAKALLACRAFREPEEHVSGIRKSLGEAAINESSVRKIVDDFIGIGYLVSDRSLRQRRAVANGKREIATLGIVTHNRPAALERCLHSFLQNTHEYGREVEFVIADDSDDAQALQNLEVINGRISSGARIRYVGSAEKQAFAKYLASAGISPTVASFTMWGDGAPGPRTGANRNSLLLATAGRLIVTLDDDVECRISEGKAPDCRLAVTSGYPLVLNFRPSRAEAIASAPLVPQDFIAAHERFLGADIAECLSCFDGLASAQDLAISEHLMESLEEGRGCVAFTQNGVYGDNGFGSPSAYLSTGGLTRTNLLESEEVYRSAVSSRAVQAAAQRVTISDGAFCMAYALGLDNRKLLPPFSPAGRNQDGLFGQLLRKCFPGLYGCHLCQAVLHDPAEERCFHKDAIWSDASRFRLTDILALAVNATGWTAPLRPMQDPIAGLGECLAEFAQLPPTEFWRLMNTAARNMAAQRAQIMDQLVRAHGSEPCYWVADIRRFCNELEAAIVKPVFLIPPELPGSDSQGRAQDYVRRFGELLAAWPEIVDCTKELQRRGTALGIDVRQSGRARKRSVATHSISSRRSASRPNTSAALPISEGKQQSAISD
jgi:hypothetical protein